MDQPIVALPQSEPTDDMSERDIVAMIGMLDYLIVEVGAIDAAATRRLIAARESLLETATRIVPLH